MKKEFVTYELLTELKELGLNVTQTTTISQVFRWFEDNYSYFVDIKTDTTPNEILGFDYTIKSWKFPPMYFDFFKDKREGNIEVIKKMIVMAKKEKQKEALIELMNMDNGETKTHPSVGEKMIKMVREARQKSKENLD